MPTSVTMRTNMSILKLYIAIELKSVYTYEYDYIWRPVWSTGINKTNIELRTWIINNIDWHMIFGLEQEGGSLIAPMALAHPLHPIGNRSRNKRRNMWVGEAAPHHVL